MNDADFTIQQHMTPSSTRKPPTWRNDNDAKEWADEIELGRMQPGLNDNKKNTPALTPSHDVCEGDYVQYNEDVSTARCEYNPDGSECLNPDTCLCRQVHKAIPSGNVNTSIERWSGVLNGDDEARCAATQIVKNQKENEPRKAKSNTSTTCNIHLNNKDAKPQNEWTHPGLK